MHKKQVNLHWCICADTLWCIMWPDSALGEAKTALLLVLQELLLDWKNAIQENFEDLKMLDLKNILIYHFGETVINFKGLGELRLHQNRTILREEWWVGGTSLLRMGSVPLLQHSGKANLFCFLFPYLFFSPLWFSAISPSLLQQKSILKWDFPKNVFTIEKSSFSNKMLSEKSHLNWIIKTFTAMNPLFLADDMVSRTLSFVGKSCLQNRGGHKCRQLHPNMSDSLERVSQF